MRITKPLMRCFGDKARKTRALVNLKRPGGVHIIKSSLPWHKLGRCTDFWVPDIRSDLFETFVTRGLLAHPDSQTRALMHCLKWGALNIFRTRKHEGWVANRSPKSLPTIGASSCLAGCSVWTNAHWARDFAYAPHMPTEVSRAPETTNPPPDSLQHQHNKHTHTHTIPLTAMMIKKKKKLSKCR